MDSPEKKAPMVWVRLILPLLIVLSGIALALIGRNEPAYEGGALLVSAGLAVLLLNLFFRIGVQGDRERYREEEARDYYKRHGRWPDD